MTITPNARTGNSPGAASTAQTGNASAQPRTTAASNSAASTSRTAGMASQATSLSGDPGGSNVLPPVNYQTGIRISTNSDNYNPIDVKGFNEQRPEVLATFQLEPVFEDDDGIPGPVGDLLDLRISSRQLRAENIIRLINELKANEETAGIVQELEGRIRTEEVATQREISFLNEMVRKLADVKDAFRVKVNDQRIKSDTALRRGRVRHTSRAGGRIPYERAAKSPREIMVQDLGFSSDGVSRFTDTKILAQLLDDLRVIVSSFSPQIFDGLNEDRASDKDSTRMIRLDDPSVGATSEFDITRMAVNSTAAVTAGAFSNSTTYFLRSMSSLTDPNDRLKMLFNIISREWRMSAGLSLDIVDYTLVNSFGLDAAEGNVFFDVVGNLGVDVLGPVPPRESSIMSLLRVTAGDDIVLPFEQLVTKTLASNRDYIPGQDFYVDSITRGQTKFDTGPLDEFARSFNIATNGLATIIEGMLDVNVLNDERLGLHVGDLMNRILTPIKEEAVRLKGPVRRVDLDTGGVAPTQDTFTPALLALAHNDAELKHYLYLYLLMLGFDSVNQFGVESKFFETLSDAGLTRDVVTSEIRMITRNVVGNTIDGTRVSRIPGLTLIVELIMGKILVDFRKDQINRSPNEIRANHEFDRMSSMGFGNRTGTPYLFNTIFEIINSIDDMARSAISGNRSERSNVDGYYSNSMRGVTKFSGVGAHTLVHLVLEIFTTLYAQYTPTTIVGTLLSYEYQSGRPLSELLTFESPIIELEKNTDAIDELVAVTSAFLTDLARIVPFAAVSDDVIESGNMRLADLIDIRSKAAKEDRLIRGIVDSIVSVGNRVFETSQEASRFFDQNGQNAATLASLLTTVDANDKLGALDAQQVILSRNSSQEHQVARANTAFLVESQNEAVARADVATPFVGDSTILPGVREALFSMLRRSGFVGAKGKNAQILSIGLPAGFIDSLDKRVSTFTAGQDIIEINRRLQIQNNVIKVNVYMQDLRFDDIVFKPQSFIFETDRFVNNAGFVGVPTAGDVGFDALVENVVIQRSLSRDQTVFDEGVGFATVEDDSYSFLSVAQKESLVYDHVMDYLLRVYVQLLTGVSMQEETFLMNDDVVGKLVDDETKALFEQLLVTHVSQFTAQPVTIDTLRIASTAIDTLLTRLESTEETAGLLEEIGISFPEQPAGANVEIAQDLVTFIDTFSPSSILFGAGSRRQRLLSPKMFERVFNILLDPDDFEIDFDKTRTTHAGQAALNSLINQGKDIREPSGELDPTNRQQGSGAFGNFRERVLASYEHARTQGEITFRQFFVVIEQLPSLDELGVSFGERRPPRTASVPSQEVEQWRDRNPKPTTFGSFGAVAEHPPQSENTVQRSSTNVKREISNDPRWSMGESLEDIL